jgi:sugar lactone lactonase YvrE
MRVQQDGVILDRCDTKGAPYACMLGGADRRTLYACTAETDDPAEARARRSGRIEQARVAVAGAGLP